jgi:uncharacterized membrane protein YphA (DoxX/SURF4 family)
MKKNNVLGMWIAIGAGIGTAIGVATKNFALWIAICVALGIAIGTIATKKNNNSNSTDIK